MLTESPSIGAAGLVRAMAGLVVHEADVAEIADRETGIVARPMIERGTTGHLSQAVLRVEAGSTGSRTVPDQHEEILYVLRGAGAIVLEDSRHDLEPEVGAHVGSGESYRLESAGAEDLVAVSVIAPVSPTPLADIGKRQTVVRLADQPSHPAGKDRKFWFIVTPEVGCSGVTQFVGWIPPGRAKDHYHEYDEVAYILEGDAVLHRGRRAGRAGESWLVYSLSTWHGALCRERGRSSGACSRRLSSARQRCRRLSPG